MTDNNNPVKPNHYRKGKIDLIESWYLRYPFNEFRTAMKTHIDKYISRYEMKNGFQDLEKAEEFKRRLEEYERLEGELD